jgi:hypothetical protein
MDVDTDADADADSDSDIINIDVEDNSSDDDEEVDLELTKELDGEMEIEMDLVGCNLELSFLTPTPTTIPPSPSEVEDIMTGVVPEPEGEDDIDQGEYRGFGEYPVLMGRGTPGCRERWDAWRLRTEKPVLPPVVALDGPILVSPSSQELEEGAPQESSSQPDGHRDEINEGLDAIFNPNPSEWNEFLKSLGGADAASVPENALAPLSPSSAAAFDALGGYIDYGWFGVEDGAKLGSGEGGSQEAPRTGGQSALAAADVSGGSHGFEQPASSTLSLALG